MTWETIEIAGKICRIAAADSPACVLIQPCLLYTSDAADE